MNMETIAILLFGMGCFVLGMYTTSQIGGWIESKIEKKIKEDKPSEKIKKDTTRV